MSGDAIKNPRKHTHRTLKLRLSHVISWPRGTAPGDAAPNKGQRSSFKGGNPLPCFIDCQVCAAAEARSVEVAAAQKAEAHKGRRHEHVLVAAVAGGGARPVAATAGELRLHPVHPF